MLGYIENNKKLYNSASGGIATALSEYFIDNNGVVAGVEYIDDFKNARYIMIDNKKDLNRVKSSKYIQSDKNSIYKKVREKLNNNSKVLFIGLPCECAGLKSFLNKEYNNLYTCALICMGPTSPKVSKEYIEHFEKEKNSKVTAFNLRSKVKGWGPPNHIKIEFENGEEYIKPFNETEYGHAFQILNKPSCLNCKFKIKNTKADITIGDYWGKEKKDKIYNRQGVSIIFIHNPKMEEIIDQLKNFRKVEKNYQEAILNNEMIIISRKKDKRRERYSKNFIEKGLFYADRKKDSNIKILIKKIIGKK